MPSSRPQSTGAVVLAAALALLMATSPHGGAARADDTPTTLSIYDASTTYQYGGCFNETTEISGSAMTRALQDGKMEEGTGTMTVETCLGFCGHNDTGSAYKFAGLEYSRECWCGVRLSALSVRLPDDECNTPCDGNTSVACGGSLKLSLYNLTTSGKNDAGRAGGEAKASLMGLIVGIVAVVGLL